MSMISFPDGHREATHASDSAKLIPFPLFSAVDSDSPACSVPCLQSHQNITSLIYYYL